MGEPVRCPKCGEPASIIVPAGAGQPPWWGCSNADCNQPAWVPTRPARTIADEQLRPEP